MILKIDLHLLSYWTKCANANLSKYIRSEQTEVALRRHLLHRLVCNYQNIFIIIIIGESFSSFILLLSALSSYYLMLFCLKYCIVLDLDLLSMSIILLTKFFF